MIQNVIPKPVCGKWIVNEVSAIGHPVLRQLFRTENEDILIATLVVFDNSKRSESLAKTNAVRKNAAVVLFQFIDNSKGGIFLKVEQLVPNNAVLKACSLIWKNILRNILQKFAENVVDSHKID